MKLFRKNNSTNTGIKNIQKIEHNNKIYYQYTDRNYNKIMSNLDFLLTSLDSDGIKIIMEDEDLLNESILESRKNRYQKQCDICGIVNEKDPDSFYGLYSEWPIPGGKWTIISFGGGERFTIQRGDKESVLGLVDDLNNGRPYPYKIIKADHSTKYGVGMEIK